MSIDALVFWVFLVAWAAVLARLAFVVVPRVVREGMRITKRVLALGHDSPLPLQIAKAESDVARIRVALERLPGLASRAQAAVALVRATPLIPRSIVAAASQARQTIRAFRGARG